MKLKKSVDFYVDEKEKKKEEKIGETMGKASKKNKMWEKKQRTPKKKGNGYQ